MSRLKGARNQVQDKSVKEISVPLSGDCVSGKHAGLVLAFYTAFWHFNHHCILFSHWTIEGTDLVAHHNAWVPGIRTE